MRRVLTVFMVFCLLAVLPHCKAHAVPVMVNLPAAEKQRLDNFFSDFSEAGLQPFVNGQIGDDALISFALRHLLLHKSGLKSPDVISAAEVNKVTERYFGRVVPGVEYRTYDGVWRLEGGVYKAGGRVTDRMPFSQVDAWWNNGDGTFLALVSVYDKNVLWKGNPHGTMESWRRENSPSGMPALKNRYIATVRLVREGDKARYILLDYAVVRLPLQNRQGGGDPPGLTRVDLPLEGRNRLDTFFSEFSEVVLAPFAKGRLSDDELTGFALRQLGKAGKGLRDVAAAEAEALEIKYFGRCVKAKEHQIYDKYWIYEGGVYRVMGRPSFGGFMPPFSQIDGLWDHGDGSFTALVSVYEQMDGWAGDPHCTVENWEKGDPRFWPELKTRYRALIRLVRDGDGEHYVLQEYLEEK